MIKPRRDLASMQTAMKVLRLTKPSIRRYIRIGQLDAEHLPDNRFYPTRLSLEQLARKRRIGSGTTDPAA